MEFDREKVTVRPHTSHNSECDILEYQIDVDTNVTYVKYVRNKPQFAIKVGDEAFEIYIGSNYNVGSTKHSYSKTTRLYLGDQLPKKYIKLFAELKKFYSEYKEIFELI